MQLIIDCESVKQINERQKVKAVKADKWKHKFTVYSLEVARVSKCCKMHLLYASNVWCLVVHCHMKRKEHFAEKVTRKHDIHVINRQHNETHEKDVKSNLFIYSKMVTTNKH